MDVKKSVIIAIGIVVVAAIVVAIAAVAFDLINGNLAGEPTPGPSATPGPSGSATPTPGASPGASPGAASNGQVYVSAILNRTSGMGLVTIMLDRDATPVDTGRLGMNIECDGQTYRNVWTPKAFDWTGSDGDALLEFGEALSPQIDTAALGIPQDRPITIIILLDTAELQRVTVTPT